MEIIKLNLIPSGVNPVCHCSQYDAGRVIRFELFDGLTPYTLSSEDEITLKVRKPDNTIVTAEVENTEDNYIDITTTEQMTACFGNNICELNITTDNKVIGSLNFVMIIEKDPIANGNPSQSVIKDLDALVAEAVGDDFYNKNETDAKIEALIDDTQESNIKVWSSNKVSQELSDKANIKVEQYIEKTPIATFSGYRMSYRTTGTAANLCYIASDSNSNCKAYQVQAGEKYEIQAFGYDVDSFYIGAIGESLVSGGQSTPTLQPILCGGSTYPTDYKNHIVEFTAQYTGYLYINERPSTNIAAYSKKLEKISVLNENGLVINNGTYTHFVYIGNGLYLIRDFTRRGPNNLFQLVHVALGYFIDNTFTEIKSYMTATTDIIGPFSIDKYGWSGGQWTGGNHSVTVNGVACPTAEQLDLSVVVNNEEVTDNGVYYGDVRITAKNKLYFAQTITGNTFDGATPAILETRVYNLINSMDVEVYIELLDDVRFAKYYGMQYINSNVENVVIPDDETIIKLSDLSSNYNMVNKQPDIILQYPDGEELHMILRPEGLGSYAHNNGSDGYGLITTYDKTYHTLISGEIINSGKQLYWSGEYKFIV